MNCFECKGNVSVDSGLCLSTGPRMNLVEGSVRKRNVSFRLLFILARNGNGGWTWWTCRLCQKLQIVVTTLHTYSQILFFMFSQASN